MYSDMSKDSSASSELNKNSASALESSVLPTPDGPRKMNEPAGRFGSFRPERERRMALESAVTASSWPMMRSCRTPSIRKSFSVSASVRLLTGTPVDMDTTSAMSSTVTFCTVLEVSSSHCFSASSRSFFRASSSSRSSAARSKFWSPMARSFSARHFRSFSSKSRSSLGSVMLRMRMRAPASSMTSMALSGR